MKLKILQQYIYGAEYKLSFFVNLTLIFNNNIIIIGCYYLANLLNVYANSFWIALFNYDGIIKKSNLLPLL